MTELQLKALRSLVKLAHTTHRALDDGEELRGGFVTIEPHNERAMSAALDELDGLPDDRPDYVLSGPARAAWALREFLGED